MKNAVLTVVSFNSWYVYVTFSSGSGVMTMNISYKISIPWKVVLQQLYVLLILLSANVFIILLSILHLLKTSLNLRSDLLSCTFSTYNYLKISVTLATDSGYWTVCWSHGPAFLKLFTFMVQ